MADRFFLARSVDKSHRILTEAKHHYSSNSLSTQQPLLQTLMWSLSVTRKEWNPILRFSLKESTRLLTCSVEFKSNDDEGIRKYFAAFHLYLDDDLPSAVIIDDFSDLFNQLNTNSRGRDMAMVRTLALCHNAIVDANKRAVCELVLSETNHGDSPRSLFIYKRWISTIFTIRGYGDGSFLLRSDGISEKTAKHSIALQYLILEEMIDR